MKLSTCLNQFFVHYLPRIKGCSETTIHSYRDTYRLLLPFAADYRHIQISSLRLEHLTVELIIAFLNHLEQNRKNTARTRNLRRVVHRGAQEQAGAEAVACEDPVGDERVDQHREQAEHRDAGDRVTGFLLLCADGG